MIGCPKNEENEENNERKALLVRSNRQRRDHQSIVSHCWMQALQVS